MFNWYRRWRARRRRAIFRFFDGLRERGIDPLSAVRLLHEHPTFNPDRHLPGVDEGDPEAIRITVAALRDVFGILGWEDGGLTEAETLDVLRQFDAYLEELKKNGDGMPNSPTGTDAARSKPSPASRHTSAASASG